jgi:hypothetical protein
MTVEATTSATATTAQPCNDKQVIKATQAVAIFMTKFF